MNVLALVLDVLIHHDDGGKHKYYRLCQVVCWAILIVLIAKLVWDLTSKA
jgi:hypothetical protein